MKLLFITSLKEYQKQVSHIIEQAGIPVFSLSETIGFRDHHSPDLLDQWFSSKSEQFDSIFIFSFTEPEKAEKALTLIKAYNSETNTRFPIRAFIMPVEQSSY